MRRSQDLLLMNHKENVNDTYDCKYLRRYSEQPVTAYLIHTVRLATKYCPFRGMPTISVSEAVGF